MARIEYGAEDVLVAATRTNMACSSDDSMPQQHSATSARFSARLERACCAYLHFLCLTASCPGCAISDRRLWRVVRTYARRRLRTKEIGKSGGAGTIGNL